MPTPPSSESPAPATERLRQRVPPPPRGAYPFGAPYCSYSLPNWGVKFFADSLLQRMLPAGRLHCIG